jgi:hypothetical protein
VDANTPQRIFSVNTPLSVATTRFGQTLFAGSGLVYDRLFPSSGEVDVPALVVADTDLPLSERRVAARRIQ